LSTHGYKHFLRLYDKTQKNFEQFVCSVGK